MVGEKTYGEFVAKYKGDKTEKEFLKLPIKPLQTCDNCEHHRHDDFIGYDTGGCGKAWEECKFELAGRFLKE